MDNTEDVINKINYEFEDWFSLLDDDIQQAMSGFFGSDDPKQYVINKILKKSIRRKKIKIIWK